MVRSGALHSAPFTPVPIHTTVITVAVHLPIQQVGHPALVFLESTAQPNVPCAERHLRASLLQCRQSAGTAPVSFNLLDPLQHLRRGKERPSQAGTLGLAPSAHAGNLHPAFALELTADQAKVSHGCEASLKVCARILLPARHTGVSQACIPRRLSLLTLPTPPLSHVTLRPTCPQLPSGRSGQRQRAC